MRFTVHKETFLNMPVWEALNPFAMLLAVHKGSFLNFSAW